MGSAESRRRARITSRFRSSRSRRRRRVAIRSRARRRSVSIWVSPGPRVPMPPPPPEPLEVGPQAPHPRQVVLELRQLDLELALGAVRVVGEDVEDHRGAVDHRHAERRLEVSLLARHQLVVAGDQVGVAAADLRLQLGQLAASEIAVGVRLVALPAPARRRSPRRRSAEAPSARPADRRRRARSAGRPPPARAAGPAGSRPRRHRPRIAVSCGAALAGSLHSFKCRPLGPSPHSRIGFRADEGLRHRRDRLHRRPCGSHAARAGRRGAGARAQPREGPGARRSRLRARRRRPLEQGGDRARDARVAMRRSMVPPSTRSGSPNRSTGRCTRRT